MRINAPSMLMPEAAMNKNRFVAGRENHIRIARQIAPMQAVTVSETVNQAANRYLGLRVFTSNAPHIFTAALWRDCIHFKPRDREVDQRCPSADYRKP